MFYKRQTLSNPLFSLVPTCERLPGKGTDTAALMATDSAGHSGSSTTTVTVNEVAPTVTLGDPPATVGVLPVSFTASATDVSPVVQAAGFTYNWNLGDSTTGTSASPSHTYSAAGTYTVSVTATDEYGKSGDGEQFDCHQQRFNIPIRPGNFALKRRRAVRLSSPVLQP